MHLLLLMAVKLSRGPTKSYVIILPAPGEVLLFSGAQLHASIPNTSGRAPFSADEKFSAHSPEEESQPWRIFSKTFALAED